MQPSMIARIAGLAFAWGLGAPAMAAEVSGVALADRLSVGGAPLVLNGAGTLHKLVFRIYVGSLYLPRKASDLDAVLAQGPRRIQMNLLRTVTAEQLVGALVGGLHANNSPAEMAAIRAPTDELVRIMRSFDNVDAKERDVFTLDFIDGATTVGLNGETKGIIAGEAFNAALTRMWLGDKPPAKALRKAMLGG
jgi:long-chain acyl-CoA synthetase